MRVTFVIASLLLGGAQRVVSTMANFWSKQGWQVHLITLAHGSALPFYELHPAVVHQPLNLARVSTNPFQAIRNNLRRVSALRHAISASAPQVVISLGEQMNVLTLVATVGLDCPVIVSERTDPHQHAIGMEWNLLRCWMYPKATAVVVQSDSVREYFSPKVQQRSRVIPNPILVPDDVAERVKSSYSNETKIVMSMGRLTEEKGFDRLIRAFAKAANKHPEWSLEIWGEGPLRRSLASLTDELRVSDRVRLPGTIQQPFAKMREAQLFVLASRYEGFPNVLCEAMACGLPVISFDCPSGPRHIIQDGVDGVLVPAGDVDDLAAAMDKLMSDARERQRLASNAPAVLDRFGVDKVMRMWEELIQDVVSETVAISGQSSRHPTI